MSGETATERFASSPTPRRTFSLFGWRLSSPYPFRFALAPGRGAAELHFDVVDAAPLPQGWDSLPPSFDASRPGARDDQMSAVVVCGDCHVLRFSTRADFFVWPERIACHLHDPRDAFAIDVWLFGTVFAYWLERRGMPTLHASVVASKGSAIGFLATSQGGKSTLAASMLQAGAELLSDDLLPLDVREARTLARPAYPQMRFWPEQAASLLGGTHRFPQAFPGTTKLVVTLEASGMGSFCPTPTPLHTIYLPERIGEGPVDITPVPAGEALFAFIRHSFLAGIVEAMGMTPRRFATLSRCLTHQRVRRLRYPAGMHHLRAVRDAILDDLGAGHEARPDEYD